MEKTIAIKSVSSLLRALVLGMLTSVLPIAAHAETVEPAMVAIAHPATSDETISRASLRAIFGMRLQKWPGETATKVFVLRDEAPEHATFSKSLLQVFPQQLRMAWDRQVFSGQGQYPEQLSSTQEMLSRVASTPGAIGYVKASEVNPNVRVLKIR
ncbi:MAG TPA: substrate-binding domain-containing protein [Accumulibacter sp.]|uniref:substrate-binding domain-containing protein n=1 Tax=Accumulibacter sp. TaxID=2053492 RepID=UPI0025F6AC27|nr:substrate-binding domain-containing protein [Accumulibacter sp.]MCM8598398.1 substrate-binding domain-containing protein [Accumulibacter sp.]MCM8662960.1 substrate-binding domain-containing protein [Accumulibacter sp.]HNC50807.1 substrate-binding domain-containing protein [Accumulibacter sp.]